MLNLYFITYLTGQIAFGFELKKYLFREARYNEMMARKFYRMHNSYVKNVSFTKNTTFM